ncbi:MAG TPA: TIGR04283 family arsenosugar biosynthesis glycosyltransferase [Acetobacteraceae bacterium]|nr:TIGR04283 family arsenosugar biosynthesis glycosyltransferase [Acetobacteraceae bacterium]
MIPALNAAATLGATLKSVEGADEVVVVDGGSEDGTVAVAERLGARVVAAPRGRGGQLAAGVEAARGEWLLLLHADTRLEEGWLRVSPQGGRRGEEQAYYFRLVLDCDDPRARRLERLVAWRSRVLGLPYGDQGLLIHRDLLRSVGGVRVLPLMEDVDLVRRLGRRRLAAVDVAAVTSAAKWVRDGWYRRSARNLVCLGLYFLGVPPRVIARLYG